ncbi:MAG: hypothetical protein ABI218_01820, partial [Caldimonas sp.]
ARGQVGRLRRANAPMSALRCGLLRPDAAAAIATLATSAHRLDAPAFIEETVMKFLPVLVLAVTTAASAAAGAATVISTQAAQERRDQNFDQALARYRATHGTPEGQAMAGESRNENARQKTHHAAQSVRGFTHRQAEKVRDFGARENARYGTHVKPTMEHEDGVHK